MKLDKKNILIGAGVVIVGYLIWKKSQINSVANSVTKSDIIIPENALVRPLVTPNGDYKTNECQKKWDSQPESNKGAIGGVQVARRNYFMYNCVNDIKPITIMN